MSDMPEGRSGSAEAVGSSVLGEQLFGELGRIVGAEHVRTSAGVLAAYARDATPLFRSLPDVVAPANADEVATAGGTPGERGPDRRRP